MREVHLQDYVKKINFTSVLAWAMALVLTFTCIPTVTVFAAEPIIVNNGTELKNAIISVAAGTVIKLANDIDAVTSATYSTKVAFTIDGDGHTIDGKGVSKTAFLFSASGANVTLKNVTMQNLVSTLSYGGGAIGVYKGKITIENSSFIGNSAPAAASAKNGGGAVVAHNEKATVKITNSTFYNNSTKGGGGAILSKEGGGTITNCTIVGNTSGYAGGGISGYNSDGAKNLSVLNSIVVGNKMGTAENDIAYSKDGGYNLWGKSANTNSMQATTKLDQTVDTMEFETGTPVDNESEGGNPYTIAISGDSPAVGGAGKNAPATDQRGILRDDEPDIGAHEFIDVGAIRKPSATPSAGAYLDTPKVMLASKTEGATIYYTLDGTEPTIQSEVFSTGNPIEIDRGLTIKAIAVLGGVASKMLEAKYTLITDNPSMSPAGGVYYDMQQVTLTAATGADIHYTLDGTTPDMAATKYTEPIAIGGNTTIKAIAYSGVRESAVTTAVYTVYLPKTVDASSGAQLDAIIKSANTNAMTVINLTQDIDAVSSATYGNGSWITINGNGHVIDGKGMNKTALRFKKDNDIVILKDLTVRNMRSDLKYGGGAVGVYKGDITIENCSFTGNSATGSEAGGGAVLSHDSSSYLRAINSTFYGNSTPGSSGEGGAIQAKGLGEIINCTIVGNSTGSKGGGLRNEGTSLGKQTVVYNSIIVGNSAKTGPDIYRATDGGNNIFGSITEVLSSQASTKSNHTVASAGLEVGAPKDNGGLTPTIALLESSMAIDGGNASVAPLLDQRGFDRTNAPDVGAFEFGGVIKPYAPVANPAGGIYSEAQVITLSSNTADAAIYFTLDGSEPTAESSVYAEPITISETSVLKAIAVKDGVLSHVLTESYVVTTLPVPNEPTFTPGAGTYSEAQNVAIACNTEETAIYYTLDDTTPTAGSALYSEPISISESKTIRAVAMKDGISSAVASVVYTIQADDSFAYVKTGSELDAAIKNVNIKTIKLTADIDAVSSATYSNKTLVIEGNGHTINGNNLTKTELRFAGSSNTLVFRNINMKNMAGNLSYGGGAIGVYKGDLLVENCSFTGNSAAGDGGAVLHDNKNGSLNITNSTFYNNRSTGSGGAVSSAATGEMINCTVINNSSTKLGSGGGVYSNTTNQFAVYNSIVSGNLANEQANDISQAATGTGNIIGDTNYAVWLAGGEPAVNESGTVTIALLSVSGSPAVDKADRTKAPEYDQRGIKRDGTPDIGAYELKTAAGIGDIPDGDLTVSSYSGVYDKQPHSIAVIDSGGGTITYCTEPDGVYSEETPSFANAGSYPVYFKINRVDGNFNEYTGSSSVDITPIELAVEQIKAADKTFDGNTVTTVDISYTGVLLGDTVTATAIGSFADADVETGKAVAVTNVVVAGNAVGNYVMPSSYDDTTADITQASGLMATSTDLIPIKEVTAKEYRFDLDSIALSASNYGTKSYQVGSVDDSDGVLNGNPSIEDNHMLRFLTESTCTTGSAITIQISIETLNYEAAQVTLTAKVLSKEPVTLGGLAIENKEYDGQAVYPNGTLSVTDSEGTYITGFITPEYNYLSTDGGGYHSQNPPRNAGVYKLTIFVDNEDYTGFMEIPFAITAKEITIQAENAKAFAGDAMPDFTYIVTGLVQGDDLITEPSYDCTATGTSAAGIFDIIPTAADAGGNYTIRYEKAALTIVQLYSFTATAGTGGSVSAIGGNYEAGAVINITATPDSSYRFANWTTSGLGSFGDSASGSTMFTMPVANVAIRANFTYNGSDNDNDSSDNSGNSGSSNSSPTLITANDITISVEETPLGQLSVPKEIEVSFNDIVGHWAKEDILFVVKKGLFSGTEVGQFSPDMTMTRAMLVTVLGRYTNEDIFGFTASRFSDVNAKTYYAPFIEWAAENGIVNGIGNGLFDPEAPVTREQMAVILTNYAQVKGIELPEDKGNDKTFIDEDSISSWATDAIHIIKNAGIISGRPDNSFDPQNTATRAEVASVLARFIRMVEK